MQKLWGKVLAGETTNPGSYSLRTLETLKNMKKGEAHIFQKACNLTFNDQYIFKVRGRNRGTIRGELEEFGLDLDNILLLKNMGLLQHQDDLSANINVEGGKTWALLYYNGMKVLASPERADRNDIPSWVLTTEGKEIKSLVDTYPKEDYIKSLAESHTHIKFAKIVLNSGNEKFIQDIPSES